MLLLKMDTKNHGLIAILVIQQDIILSLFISE
jgi:hypothetical protein